MRSHFIEELGYMMFTERENVIIAILSNSTEWVKGSYLAELLGVSHRTIQMDIKKINESQGTKMLVKSNNRLGYFIEDKHIIKKMLNKDEIAQHIDAQGFYGRTRLMLALLLFEKDFVSIGNIADRLYVSKSTVNTTIPQIKRVIRRTTGVTLEISSNKGIRIVADEHIKRFMCMKMLGDNIKYSVILGISNFDDYYFYRDSLRETVSKLLLEDNLIITGNAFEYFLKYIAIGIFRSKNGYGDTEIESENKEFHPFIVNVSEYIQREFDYQLTNLEKEYIESRVFEMNLVPKYLEISDIEKFYVPAFLEEIEVQTNLQLNIDRSLLVVMSNHINRLLKRIKSGRINLSENTKELSLEYPLELHLLKTCLNIAFDEKIPNAEMDSLILYMAILIHQKRDKLNVLLISDRGAGVIYNIEEKLKEYFGNWMNQPEAVPTYIFHQKVEACFGSYDVHITTEDSLSMEFNNLYLINQFPIPKQLEQLRIKMERIHGEHSVKRQSQFDLYYTHYNNKQSFSKDEVEDYINTLTGKAYVSVETVGGSLLCIFSHNLDNQYRIRKYSGLTPFEFNDKQIDHVLIAHYGGQLNMIDFFDFVQHKMRI